LIEWESGKDRRGAREIRAQGISDKSIRGQGEARFPPLRGGRGFLGFLRKREKTVEVGFVWPIM